MNKVLSTHMQTGRAVFAERSTEYAFVRTSPSRHSGQNVGQTDERADREWGLALRSDGIVSRYLVVPRPGAPAQAEDSRPGTHTTRGCSLPDTYSRETV